MSMYLSKELEEIGINEALSKEIAGQIRAKYLDITKWHLYDDVIRSLEKAVARGYENIIVSNHVPELPELVEGLGLNEYFTDVYSSALIGYEKPNVHFYQKVLENIDDASDATMIGDNYIADVDGAINAGIKAILVRKENTYNYNNYSKDLDGIFVFC